MKTILVVGTTELRRERILAVLTTGGHSVVAVATMAEALAYVAASLPQLVVMDLDADAASITAASRQIKTAHPDTFILQIGQRLAESETPPEIDASIDAYLVEPIDSQELLILVRSLLRLQKVEADLRDSEERLLMAQESAGLAILDWVVSSNSFIHSANFAEVFDLEMRGENEPVSAAMLLERIHPEDLDALLGEFSGQNSVTRDFEKEFRIVGRDGGTRWIASRGRLFGGPQGAPERMLSLNYDITQRKLAERANAELASIVASSIDAIIGIDLAANVTSWNGSAERLFGVEAAQIIGRPLIGALHGISEEERLLLTSRVTDGQAHEFETRQVRGEHQVIDVAVTSAPIYAPGGAAIGASLIVRDVSQQKQREDHVRFLMRELTHRSKNLLAVIQAMARQSLTRDIAPAEFVRRFTERLAGLAGSHDLLSRVDWRGASLMDLIRSQLNHYMDLFGTRILLDGEELIIRPEAAQNIGIALHELSTNAAKYGALSNDTGQVTISWRFENRPDRMMMLVWRESGGPPVVAPTRRGFGHVVMDRISGSALGGKSGIQFEPTGVVWTLDVPASAVVMEYA